LNKSKILGELPYPEQFSCLVGEYVVQPHNPPDEKEKESNPAYECKESESDCCQKIESYFPHDESYEEWASRAKNAMADQSDFSNMLVLASKDAVNAFVKTNNTNAKPPKTSLARM